MKYVYYTYLKKQNLNNLTYIKMTKDQCRNKWYAYKKLGIKYLKSKCIRTKALKADQICTEDAKVDNVVAKNVTIDEIKINPYYAQSLISVRHDSVAPSTLPQVIIKGEKCPVFNLSNYNSFNQVSFPAVSSDLTKGVQEMVFDIILPPIENIKWRNDNTTMYILYINYTTDGDDLYMFNTQTNSFTLFNPMNNNINENYVITYGVTRLVENAWQDLHLGGFLSQQESEAIKVKQDLISKDGQQILSDGNKTNTIYVSFFIQSNIIDDPNAPSPITICPGSKIQLIY